MDLTPTVLLVISFSLVFIFWHLYDITSFVLIFAVVLFFLVIGMLLVTAGLGFAGSTLILINGSGVAVLFLFVCILSGREQGVRKRYPDGKYLVFLFFSLVFYLELYLQTAGLEHALEELRLVNAHVCGLWTDILALFIDGIAADLSLSAHRLFMQGWLEFSFLFLFLGGFLLTIMIVAVNLTASLERFID